MIDRVSIKRVVINRDHEGFFAELVKFGEETFHEIRQTSYSETGPGLIKAFHLHKGYWEMWCIVKGRARVVLADLRDDSPTKGEIMDLVSGEENMQVIAIPPGVLHGYQVLGNTPMGIIYHAGEAYDAMKQQIEHIPHDSPRINFNWDLPPHDPN